MACSAASMDAETAACRQKSLNANCSSAFRVICDNGVPTCEVFVNPKLQNKECGRVSAICHETYIGLQSTADLPQNVAQRHLCRKDTDLPRDAVPKS